MRILLTVEYILFLVAISICQPQTSLSQSPAPTKTVILDSLLHPWGIAFINKDEAYITEKEGNLLRVNLSTKSKRIVQGFPNDLAVPLLIRPADYPPLTYPLSLDGQTIWGNAGILDIALHPAYSSNHIVYISYVSERDKTYALKVISATVKNDSLSNIKTILNPTPYVPGLWHFGGGLCVHNDHLYITVGERLFYEGAKQGLPIAQDISDARGAIYRLNLDGGIPTDNPDWGEDAVPGIYVIGIRAAQGIDADPSTGEIWFTEHGTIQGDEINMLKKGANYGWPNITSGKWRTPDYQPEALDAPSYTDPVHYWSHTVAPTGLTFYTGTQFPTWQGNIIVPGLSRGSIWRMVLTDNIIVSAEELFLNDRVRSRKAAMSPDGHLYILTDEDNGKLIRITNSQ